MLWPPLIFYWDTIPGAVRSEKQVEGKASGRGAIPFLFGMLWEDTYRIHLPHLTPHERKATAEI